jgi:GAF domain-containing protein
MDRFDVLGDDERDLDVASGAVLSSAPDDTLQSIVSAAAIAAEAPIALVSLVLRRIQLFRAHIGLPPDLAAAGATDRCVSFCQLVVRDKRPLAIEDALRDARVPQALVDAYGVRAYLGFPLEIEGVVVGTLCILDVRPREFSPEQRLAVERLARVASERLAQLVQAPGPATSTAELGAGRLRGELSAAIGDTVAARIASVELRPLLRAQQTAGARSALAVLADAARAAEDLDGALGRVEASLRRAGAVLGAMETSLGVGPAAGRQVELRDVVASAAALVQCGVKWRGSPARAALDLPGASAIARIATTLSALAARGGRSPFDLDAHVRGDTVELRVGGGAVSALVAAEVADGLGDSADGAAVRADGSAVVVRLPAARWAR